MTHLINGGGGGGVEIRLSCVSITMCDDLDTFTDIWAQVCMSLVKREREVTLEMTPHTSPKISIDSLHMCFNTNHMTRVSYLHMGHLSTYICRYGYNQIKLFSSTYTLCYLVSILLGVTWSDPSFSRNCLFVCLFFHSR